jgi:hypothetical protein
MKDLTFSRRMAEVNSSRVSIRVMFSISISANVSIEDFSIETSAEMEMENITRMETRELFTT